MYVYFNDLGIIKEIVGESNFRQGSSGVNDLYFYFAGDRTITQLVLYVKVNDSEETVLTHFLDVSGGEGSNKVDNVEIPYNPNQQLKYFAYYTPYTMYKYTLTNEDLAYDGVIEITAVAYFNSGNEAQGKLIEMVEDSVLLENPTITKAEYEDLLNEINKLRVEIASKKAKLYKHSITFSTSGNITHTGKFEIFSNSATPFTNVQAILDYCEENNITVLGNASENTGGQSGLVNNFSQVVSVYVATVDDEKVLKCEVRYVSDAKSEGAPQGFILHTTTAQIVYINNDSVVETLLDIE